MTNEEKINVIAKHVERIMSTLGIPYTESTQKTPLRVAKMYVNEVFKNQTVDEEELRLQVTTFENKMGQDMIIVKDIPFYSTCEHHLMPFSGKISIGYIPRHRLIGWSKLPRIVKFYSKKAQLQEHLVSEIADFIYKELDPLVVFVHATECVHTCVTARGIETYCETDTLVSRGNDARYKSEFLSRINK